MLSFDHVDSFYDRSHILHDVCLDVPDGEVTAILGRNGTGKTTLLKTLMGLTDRMDGEIRLDSADLGSEPTFKRARSGIAYVPQGREIIPDFSIRENILMGSFARADGKREIPPLVAELFPYLMDNLDRNGGVLSGGQQQQLGIVRALTANPTIPLLAPRSDRDSGRTECVVRPPCRAPLRHDGEGAGGGVGRHPRPQRRAGPPPHGGVTQDVGERTKPARRRCTGGH
jgi:ABC-type branched-subunit amino acid transport system ATPase component